MILAVHHEFPWGALIVIGAVLLKGLSSVFGKARGAAEKREPVSEQERTRRFLAALGQAPAAPAAGGREPLGSLRPKIPPPADPHRRELPSPPIVSPALRRSRPRVPPPTAAWLVPEVPPLPGLTTPAVPEFRTRAAAVTAIAGERPTLDESPVRTVEHPSTLLRQLLRNPASLRTAFLLREVLGPPRGLPETHPAPNLPAS